MHEDGTSSIFGERAIPPVCTEQTARGVRTGGYQIVVPHYFNTEENLDYVGPITDILYYSVNEMSGGERKYFRFLREAEV